VEIFNTKFVFFKNIFQQEQNLPVDWSFGGATAFCFKTSLVVTTDVFYCCC